MENTSEKMEPDLKSKKRNRIIIWSVIVINFLLQFSLFAIVGNFSPSAEQLGFISGRYLITTLFYLLGYRLGRGSLKPTFEENKQKISKGIMGIIICIIISFLVLIQNKPGITG